MNQLSMRFVLVAIGAWLALSGCQEPSSQAALAGARESLLLFEAQRIAAPSADERAFGVAIAYDGSWLAVTSQEPSTIPNVPRQYIVRVYRIDGAVHTLVQELRPQDFGFGAFVDARFGEGLALDGDRLIIGVPRADPIDSPQGRAGAVLVLRRSGERFELAQTPLRPPPIDSTEPGLPSERQFVGFGISVALDGPVLAVGAPSFDARAGRLFVYHHDGAMFTEADSIRAPLARTWDEAWGRRGPRPGSAFDTRFGAHVAVAGDLIAVAHSETSGNPQPGRVHIYQSDASGHHMLAELMSPIPFISDKFGYRFAFDGTTLAACAETERDGGASTTHVFVHDFDAAHGMFSGLLFEDNWPGVGCDLSLARGELAAGTSGYLAETHEARSYARVGDPAPVHGGVSSATFRTDEVLAAPSAELAGFGRGVVLADRTLAVAVAHESVPGAVFIYGERFASFRPFELAIFREPRDLGCLTCPEPGWLGHLAFSQPSQAQALYGSVSTPVEVSPRAQKLLSEPGMHALEPQALQEAAGHARLPVVALGADGDRILGALDFDDTRLVSADEVGRTVSDLAAARPKPRADFGAVYDGHSVLVIGGVSGGKEPGQLEPASDLWRFDVDTESWTPVQAKGLVAIAQVRATALDAQRNTLYVLASASKEQAPALFSVNMEKGTVTEVSELAKLANPSSIAALAAAPNGTLIATVRLDGGGFTLLQLELAQTGLKVLGRYESKASFSGGLRASAQGISLAVVDEGVDGARATRSLVLATIE